MKVTDYIAELLHAKNINTAFIFTGGAIAHMVDSVYQHGGFTTRCVLHEQSGGFAIDAYYKATGNVGVMLATSGPGGTNLVTSIATSYYDSIPAVYITGQVSTAHAKYSDSCRQQGFQETDIVSIVKPITKYAVRIESPKSIRYELEYAIHYAKSGRPGPVLIDLPMDIQQTEIDTIDQLGYITSTNNYSNKYLRDFKQLLANSECPILILGGGSVNNQILIKVLVETLKIPVVTTFGGYNAISHYHDSYRGTIGKMGNITTNEIVRQSDLVIGLGCRFGVNSLRGKRDEFAPDAKIVHVDIDINELYNPYIPKYQVIHSSVSEFLHTVMNDLLEYTVIPYRYSEWYDYTKALYDSNKFPNTLPYQFFRTLVDQMDENGILVADAGQNVMLAYQATVPKFDQSIITSVAHSPMGYSLPAAMGAVMSGRQTVVTIGDGGFQVNIQELQTIKHYNLPIKIFIINNHNYGAIQDYQDFALSSRHYASTYEYGYSHPNFQTVVQAYGIEYCKLDIDNLEESIHNVLAKPNAVVCEVDLGSRINIRLDV